MVYLLEFLKLLQLNQKSLFKWNQVSNLKYWIRLLLITPNQNLRNEQFLRLYYLQLQILSLQTGIDIFYRNNGNLCYVKLLLLFFNFQETNHVEANDLTINSADEEIFYIQYMETFLFNLPAARNKELWFVVRVLPFQMLFSLERIKDCNYWNSNRPIRASKFIQYKYRSEAETKKYLLDTRYLLYPNW